MSQVRRALLTMFLVSAAIGEVFEATDQPIDMRGASGQTLQWLQAFDHPARTFSYNLSDGMNERTATVHRVQFDSPFRSPFPENNTVHGELYLPRNTLRKVPAVIVLDILQGNALLPRMVSRRLAQEGIAAFYISMPYYNERRPQGGKHERMIEDDPRAAIDALRQTVMDIRRSKALLSSRPEIDPERIGITGISLGGIMTALAAGVDGSFYRVVPILSGGNLASIIFTAPETRRVRERLAGMGINENQLNLFFAPVEPLNFASRIRPEVCLMINARRDGTIPAANAEALAGAIGGPTVIWTPLGHIDSVIYLPNILQKTADFFNGKPVTGLEMQAK